MNAKLVPGITMPMTRPRSSDPYRSAISAKPTTHVTASAAPWTSRAANSQGRLVANAKRSVAAAEREHAADERRPPADAIRDGAHRHRHRQQRHAEGGEQQADHRRRRAEPPAQIGQHRHGDRVRDDVGEGRERDEGDGDAAGSSEADGHFAASNARTNARRHTTEVHVQGPCFVSSWFRELRAFVSSSQRRFSAADTRAAARRGAATARTRAPAIGSRLDAAAVADVAAAVRSRCRC